jgi:hypothetical protein
LLKLEVRDGSAANPGDEELRDKSGCGWKTTKSSRASSENAERLLPTSHHARWDRYSAAVELQSASFRRQYYFLRRGVFENLRRRSWIEKH